MTRATIIEILSSSDSGVIDPDILITERPGEATIDIRLTPVADGAYSDAQRLALLGEEALRLMSERPCGVTWTLRVQSQRSHHVHAGVRAAVLWSYPLTVEVP